MSDPESQKRYTVLTVLGMLLATAIAVFIGMLGFGLWMTTMMSFAKGFDEGTATVLEQGLFYFLMAGPFAAGAGLMLGWLLFLFGNPKGGIKWVLLIPILWGLGVLGLIGIAYLPVCDGSFTCGLSG